MESKIERNCIAATTLFIASVVADGLSALDPFDEQHAPSSMRCTAAVLIACLAAPPLRQRFVFEQRLLLGLALAGIAIIGMHQGPYNSRVVDAIYTWLVLSLTLYSFTTGGIEDIGTAEKSSEHKMLSPEAPPYVYRESTCCLAMATLAYSGFRILRQAFAHPENARGFQVAGIAWDGTERLTTGYAASSTASAIFIAFGGSLAVGLAAVLFASRDLREVGTGAKKELLTICAFLQLFAAYAATVAWSEQYTSLTAIFGDGGCKSELCPAAGLARRTALMNALPMPIWLNALGTAVLAYAPDAKVQTRADEKGLSPPVVAWGILSLVGCLLVTIAYSSFSGPGAYIDYCAVLSIAAVAVSSFWDTWYGSLLFLIAIGVDEVFALTMQPAGEMLTYFTHCSLLVSFILLALRVVLSGITEYFWDVLPPGVVAVIDDGVGLLTIAGTSVTVVLFLGSCSLMISYPGNWIGPGGYEQPDNKYARTWVAAILEHFTPVLVWLPMYTRKQEVNNVTQNWRLATWMASELLPVLIWVIALAGSSQAADHSMWSYEGSFLFALISVVLIPWVAISFV